MNSKPKILHLFNHYLPQTENWSYKLIKNTPEVKIFIGARVYLKNNFYDPNFTFIAHPIGDLDTYSNQIATTSSARFLEKAIIKIFKFFLGTADQYILEAAQSNGIEIIHAHFADVAWYFKKLPQQLDKPFVVSFYGWDYEKLPTVQPAYQKHYQQLFKMAAAIICEGNHGAQVLEGMGCPPSKLKVISLGVETPHIPFHQRAKQKEELHLLQLATFNEKKGHHYTVKAFAKALQTCPNMTLTLIGGEGAGNIKKEILEYIKTNDLANKIKVLDHLDYSQLYTYLKSFQVFIHPSCYAEDRDCEGGAPIVLLDAQATGMPVIATEHCDIPGEVKHGLTGLLAPEKDINELATHIQRFYEMEEEEYLQFSTQARKHVCKHFDSSQNGKKIKALYESLL